MTLKIDTIIVATDKEMKFANQVWLRNREKIAFSGDTVRISETALFLNDIEVKHSKCSTFGEKIAAALLHTKSEYVLLLLADYLIVSTPLQHLIESILVDLDPDYFRLTSNPNNGTRILNKRPILLTTGQNRYQINTQPALWRRDLISKLVDEEATPWKIEQFYNIKHRKHLNVTLGVSRDIYTCVELVKKGKIKRSLCLIHKIDFSGMEKMSWRSDLSSSLRGVFNKGLFFLGLIK